MNTKLRASPDDGKISTGVTEVDVGEGTVAISSLPRPRRHVVHRWGYAMIAGQRAVTLLDVGGERDCADRSLLAPKFRIESSVRDAVTVVAVHGELDTATDAALRGALATTTSHSVALDLSGVEFMGCSTLKVLFEAAANHRALGQDFSISAASGSARRLLALTTLHQLVV